MERISFFTWSQGEQIPSGYVTFGTSLTIGIDLVDVGVESDNSSLEKLKN